MLPSLVSACALFAGCQSIIMGEGGISDGVPPTLIVEGPARGAVIEDGTSVLVRGTASDASGMDTISVGDQSTSVNADGSFELRVELEPGITVLDIVARDRSGTEASEQRSVVTGTWSQAATPIDDALVAYAGTEAFHQFESALVEHIARTNLTAFAQSQNPIVDTSGCSGARVDVNSLTVQSSDVSFMPQNGGIAVAIELHGVHSALNVNYKVVCIGSSANALLDIDTLRLSGLAVFGLEGENISFRIDNAATSFVNFNLDVGGLAGTIVDAFSGDVESSVASMMTDAVKDSAQTAIQPYLTELRTQTWGIDVLGLSTQVRLQPTRLEVSDMGLLVESSVALNFPGLNSAEYVMTKSSAPNAAAMASTESLRVGVADDVGNQILAALWGQGKLSQHFDIPSDHPANSLLGFASLDLDMQLPPMLKGNGDDGAAQLVVGDMLLSVKGVDGRVLERISVSAKIDLTLGLGDNSAVNLGTGDTEIWLAALDEAGQTALSTPIPDALKSLVIDEFTVFLQETMGSLPTPQLDEIAVVSSSLGVTGGYLLMGGQLTRTSP